MDALFNRYLALFPQRFDSTTKRISSKVWRGGSQWHHLSDLEILETVSGGTNIFRAVSRGDLTKFAVLKFSDVESSELTFLTKQLDSLIKDSSLTYFRYLFDEITYFYFHLTEWTKTSAVDRVLSNWLTSLDLDKDETAISVPKANESIPLPLQPGFYWCNSSGDVTKKRDDLELEEAVQLFLSNVEEHSVTFDTFAHVFNPKGYPQTKVLEFAQEPAGELLEIVANAELGVLAVIEFPANRRTGKMRLDRKARVATDSEGVPVLSRRTVKTLSRQSKREVESGAQAESSDRLSCDSGFAQLSLPFSVPTLDYRAPPSV